MHNSHGRSNIPLEPSLFDSIKSGFAGIVGSFASGIFSSIGRETNLIFDNLELRVLMLQERLLANLAAALIVGVSGIFLIASAYFFMVEYLTMSRASAFFFLAVLLFMLAWIIKKYNGGGNHAKIKKYGG